MNHRIPLSQRTPHLGLQATVFPVSLPGRLWRHPNPGESVAPIVFEVKSAWGQGHDFRSEGKVRFRCLKGNNRKGVYVFLDEKVVTLLGLGFSFEGLRLDVYLGYHVFFDFMFEGNLSHLKFPLWNELASPKVILHAEFWGFLI